MIEAIIFDADGVVINTEPLYDKGDREFFKFLSIQDDVKKYRHLTTGKSLEDGTAIMQKKFNIPGSLADIIRTRMSFIKKYYHGVTFVPGFLDFFTGINQHYKTAIATSSNPKLFSIAETELKLAKLFSGHIYFLKDAGNISKPAPDIFLYTAKMLSIEPKNCLVIEDAVNGVKAAKNAGMKCIALATTHDKQMLKEADQIVNNFSEIDLGKF